METLVGTKGKSKILARTKKQSASDANDSSTKRKRKKKTPLQATKVRCARLWQDIGKALYRVCQVPGCLSRCQVVHHIFPVGSYPSMSFNLQNGYASCNGHHKFFCHGDPEGFREVVIEWLKPIDYISMKAYASTYQRHFKLEDYTLVEKYLVAIRDMVQNGEYLTRDVVSHMIREDHIRNALLVPGPTDGLSPEERAAIQKTAIQYAGKGGNDAEEVE